MNRKVLIIILVILLAALLICASFLYKNLTSIDPLIEEDTSVEETPTLSDDLAADFFIYNEDDELVHLSDYFGKPIVLNFWATWCGPCRSEMPYLEQAYQDYGEEIQFMLVDITDGRDTKEIVQAFLEDNAFSFPVFYDTELDAVRTYGVYSIPMTVFIQSDGAVKSAHIGSMTEEILMNGIESIQFIEK